MTDQTLTLTVAVNPEQWYRLDALLSQLSGLAELLLQGDIIPFNDDSSAFGKFLWVFADMVLTANRTYQQLSGSNREHLPR